MFGLFSWRKPDARQIFHFHDGQRTRSVDPIRVWTDLQLDPQFEMDRHAKELSDDDNRTAAVAMRITTAAVRRAFGIPQFDNGGLTDQESIAVFGSYTTWLDAQKKSTK